MLTGTNGLACWQQTSSCSGSSGLMTFAQLPWISSTFLKDAILAGLSTVCRVSSAVLLPYQLTTHEPTPAILYLQLVSSLVPMWQQERWRLGGSRIPPPPPSPRRRPRPLCPAVEAVREEFRVGEAHWQLVVLSTCKCKNDCSVIICEGVQVQL